MASQRSGRQTKGRLTLVVLALLSVCVMGASIAVAVLLARRHPQPEPTQMTRPVVTGGFPCSAAEASRLHPFRSGLLKADPTRLSFLDLTGVEKWGVDCAMLSPACFIADAMAVVADLGGSTYLVVDENGVLAQSAVSGLLTGAAVSAADRFVLLVEQAENKGMLRMVSATSGKAFEWDFISRKSGFILSASFSPAGQVLDVVSLDTDSHRLQTMLKRLDASNGAAMGQMLPEAGEIWPVVAYDTSDQPVLVGSHGMTAFKADATLAYQVSFFKIHQAVTTARGVLIIAEPGPESKPSVYLVAADGTAQEGGPLSGVPAFVAQAKDQVAVAVGSEIYFFRLQPFRQEGVAGAGAEIVRLAFHPGGGVVAVTQEGVGRIAIP